MGPGSPITTQVSSSWVVIPFQASHYLKSDRVSTCYLDAVGRVAVVVSNVSSYQNRYYFYDNDHKNSLVAAIDELGIGFVMENRKGSKCRMVLMKRRGILTDAIGTVVREGPWTPNLADPGKHLDHTLIECDRRVRLTSPLA